LAAKPVIRRNSPIASKLTVEMINPMEPRPSNRFTTTQWLIITIAAIGFLFDTYELLMTPLVGVPAIAELLQVPLNNPLVTEWIGRMIWLSALCGGVFGLLGGWLIDRFGRKRIMAASIFVYSLSPVAAAFSTSLGWFIFFRCTTFIGVCVEFVAAITWLAELFPDPRRKKIVLGSTQAFASVGGLLVTMSGLSRTRTRCRRCHCPKSSMPMGRGVTRSSPVSLRRSSSRSCCRSCLNRKSGGSGGRPAR
jgi:hypothetical protein